MSQIQTIESAPKDSTPIGIVKKYDYDPVIGKWSNLRCEWVTLEGEIIYNASHWFPVPVIKDSLFFSE